MFGTLFISVVLVFMVVFIVMPLVYLALCFMGWGIIMVVAFVYASIAYVVGKVDHFFRKLTA